MDFLDSRNILYHPQCILYRIDLGFAVTVIDYLDRIFHHLDFVLVCKNQHFKVKSKAVDFTFGEYPVRRRPS